MHDCRSCINFICWTGFSDLWVKKIAAYMQKIDLFKRLENLSKKSRERKHLQECKLLDRIPPRDSTLWIAWSQYMFKIDLLRNFLFKNFQANDYVSFRLFWSLVLFLLDFNRGRLYRVYDKSFNGITNYVKCWILDLKKKWNSNNPWTGIHSVV